ncbi:MAG: hypothetical protein WCL08_05955, partial [Verrucomicrobiota bacterium]
VLLSPVLLSPADVLALWQIPTDCIPDVTGLLTRPETDRILPQRTAPASTTSAAHPHFAQGPVTCIKTAVPAPQRGLLCIGVSKCCAEPVSEALRLACAVRSLFTCDFPPDAPAPQCPHMGQCAQLDKNNRQIAPQAPNMRL